MQSIMTEIRRTPHWRKREMGVHIMWKRRGGRGSGAVEIESGDRHGGGEDG